METYQEHIKEEEKENICGFCGEPCEYDFCNSEHFRMYFND